MKREGPAENGCRYPAAAAYPGTVPYAPQLPRQPHELQTHTEDEECPGLASGGWKYEVRDGGQEEKVEREEVGGKE